MTVRSKPRRILAAAFVVYSLAMIGFVYTSYRANDNHIVYALDDAYIHMAMAKNMVEYGTFGITPYEFSAASSSPLWTFLLAGFYFVFGISEWLPLLLNSLCGIGAIFIIWKFGLDAGLREWWLGLLVAAIILLIPVVPLAFTGMEHLLHLAAVLLMVYFLWRLLGQGSSIGLNVLWTLGVSTTVAVAARYESLFLVAAASIALAAKRRWAILATLVTFALIPVCVFGLFAIANGQHFLPNSLLLKGNIPQLNGVVGVLKALGFDGLKGLFRNPHLCVLIIGLVVLFWRHKVRGRRLDGGNMLTIVVVAATVLHLQFARTGWFYRYEAYLVGLALMVLFVQFCRPGDDRALPDLRQGSWVTLTFLGATLILLLYPLTARAAAAHFKTVQATRNIYQQQYQMGRFLHRFYEGEPVAANDVGAINYLAHLKCLDLWGLGSQEIARHKRKGSYSTAVMRELTLAQNVRVAAIYTSWFKGKTSLPEEWTVVGRWTIQNNVVCGSETVDFVATEPSEAHCLLAHLRSFYTELPPGVVWEELIAGEVTE